MLYNWEGLKDIMKLNSTFYEQMLAHTAMARWFLLNQSDANLIDGDAIEHDSPTEGYVLDTPNAEYLK